MGLPESIERLRAGEWQWNLRSHAEERFAFACSGCGSCCRGAMTIRLNLADLQRMAGYLGFERTGQLFEGGFVEELPLEQGIGFRPALRFIEKPSRFCPFLENVLDDGNWTLTGRCRLHPDLKPLVCKLAPLGREVCIDDALRALEQWVFTEPVKDCPGCRVEQLQRVTDWAAAHTRELALETQYFRVMERLTRGRAAGEVFRSFHRDLHVCACLEDYLGHWLGWQA